jgi:hypothetical protein
LAAYFAHVGLKEDPESKDRKIGGTAVAVAKPLYEVVSDMPSGEVKHARTGLPVAPQFPFTCQHESPQQGTRREQLAAWITSANNPYFATSMVNRLWGYLTGVGLIEPLDDIRAGNPPSNPELLKHLTDEFVRSQFDVRHILRQICNSRTYQLSVATSRWNEDDQVNYSHAKARRLPAEVLYDSVYRVTGAQSAIPGVAPGTRAAELPDVSFNLADGFLNNLGRPVRESACECERSQDLQLGPVMALVSGPTIGSAIGDSKNYLNTMATGSAHVRELVEQIYLRVLSRYPSTAEVASVEAISSAIESDHQRLSSDLSKREDWWKGRREELEAERIVKLERTRADLAARQQSIAHERERQEKKRLDDITKAEQALDELHKKGLAIANEYLGKNQRMNNWFPLAAVAVKSTSKAILTPQADRSILASGSADKATYNLVFRTPLRNIRGLRLEALPVEGLNGGGPGLPGNGNFVVTEIEVRAASIKKPEEKTYHKLVDPKADFTQPGFDAQAVADATTRDQRGWAISPRGGSVHWLCAGFEKPIDYEGGTELSIAIDQYHSAVDHRLARFRISVTTDEGEIFLGLPEELAAVASIAKKDRTQENASAAISYVSKNDAKWIELREAVNKAKQPVPEDSQVTSLKQLVEALEKPTIDDSKLVQLRADHQASSHQLKNWQLTLAQDLTWALINSPAFLFNH